MTTLCRQVMELSAALWPAEGGLAPDHLTLRDGMPGLLLFHSPHLHALAPAVAPQPEAQCGHAARGVGRGVTREG